MIDDGMTTRCHDCRARGRRGAMPRPPGHRRRLGSPRQQG